MILSPCIDEVLPPHEFEFDPTYGYALEALLKVEAPVAPPDFAAFWERTYEETRAVPLNLATRESALSDGDNVVLEAEWDSLGGFRVGGWIVLPRHGIVESGIVASHGYGGREAPDQDVRPNSATIFPCARGFHRSAAAGIPNVSDSHVVHGIESRKSYVHRGCAADIWSAVSALIEVAPAAAHRLYFRGGSFGGGIGALAVPWEKRFTAASLNVPSFGPHPLRVTLPCAGSGRAVSQLHRQQPEILEVLQYFDSVTAARHIKVPTIVSAALFDPSVPPPGQFAVYNALSFTRELFVKRAGHFGFAGEVVEAAALESQLQHWFDRHDSLAPAL